MLHAADPASAEALSLTVNLARKKNTEKLTAGVHSAVAELVGSELIMLLSL